MTITGATDLMDKAPARRTTLPFRLKGLTFAQSRHLSTNRTATIVTAGAGAPPALSRAKGGWRSTMFGGSSMVAHPGVRAGRRQIDMSSDLDHSRSASLFVAHSPPGRGDRMPDIASLAARHVGRHELAADRGAESHPRTPPAATFRARWTGRHRSHHRRLRPAAAVRRKGRRAGRCETVTGHLIGCSCRRAPTGAPTLRRLAGKTARASA